ncbi:MAG: ATP-binding protein [Gallionella sp.]|nr:sensor histidine kinase [Gallionella sp.]
MLTFNWRDRLQGGRWLMLAMFALLHGVILLGLDSPWSPPLLLAHLGLFLLWQPLWRGEREVGRAALLLIVLIALIALFWLNWWTITFWLIGLFGLVGARVFVFRDSRTRWLYLALMLYLLTLLLLWVVPNVFAAQSALNDVGRVVIGYALPLLLVVLAVMPMRHERVVGVQAVDFIYSLLLFLLLTLVVLGSLAFMTLANLPYFDALLRTLFLMGLLLLIFGSLWNPRFGFGGLQVQFSRYLLNVGTPFESWLTKLADAAKYEPDAAGYLHQVIALLAEFSWLSGVSWQSPDGRGQFGQVSNHTVEVQEAALQMTLYAKQPLSPALLLHINLLVKLIDYSYQAKQREQTLRDITRLQTVYETGARLTHDLKNMLQSLLSLTTIAQSTDARAQQLLKQQLPIITQRIEMAVNKLEQPQIEGDAMRLALSVWWDALKLRNRQHDIEWHEPDTLPDMEIPSAMFDCVMDNLLDNAIRKRQSEITMEISVELQLNPLRLSVTDSGSPVPTMLSAKLLSSVVVSEGGLGIGLYQAARWAEQLSYSLTLASNREGKVGFELRGAAK